MTAASVAASNLGNPGINNTAYLFFALVAAFIFFVTVRGDLPKWLGLFGLAGSGASGANPSAPAAAAPAAAGVTLPTLPAIPAVPSLLGN